MGHHFGGIEMIEPNSSSHARINAVYNDHQRPRPELGPRPTSGSGKDPFYFEEYLFTKEPALLPGQKESWARCRKTLVPRPQDDMAEYVRKQYKRGISPKKQLGVLAKGSFKRLQIDQLTLNRTKTELREFEYVPASLELDMRGKELSAMHVIIRRQLRPGVRYDSSMVIPPPRPAIASEVVDLNLRHEPQRPGHGGFTAAPQMSQGPFHPGHVNAHPGNAGRLPPEIHDPRFQQHGGPPKGGPPNHGHQPAHPHGQAPVHGMPFLAEEHGGKHGFPEKVHKGKEQKKSPQIIAMDQHKPHKKAHDFSDISDQDGEMFVMEDFEELKKPKDKKKGPIDMDEDDFADFFAGNNKKSKGHTKKPNIISMSPKPKKNNLHEDSDSESASDDAWSHLSDDSFPTTISKDSDQRGHGGRSHRKEKEVKEEKKDGAYHKAGKKNKDYHENFHKPSLPDRHDRHDREPKQTYREHTRKTPEPKKREPSPAHSRRSGGMHYPYDDVIVEPGNTHRRREREVPRYVGGYPDHPRHRRDPSYDSEVHPNDHLRGLGLGRSQSVYHRKIANSAYSSNRSNHYDSEEEYHNRIREEAKTKRMIQEEVQNQLRLDQAKKEEKAKLERQIRDEVAREQEQARMREDDERRFREDQERDRIARERVARQRPYDRDPLPRGGRDSYGYGDLRGY